MKANRPVRSSEPLGRLDEWEDFFKERYPAPAGETRMSAAGVAPGKPPEEFRA